MVTQQRNSCGHKWPGLYYHLSSLIVLPLNGTLYSTKQRKEINASFSSHRISCRPRYVITQLFTLHESDVLACSLYIRKPRSFWVITATFTRTFSVVIKILSTVHWVSEADCFLLQVSGVLSTLMTIEKILVNAIYVQSLSKSTCYRQSVEITNKMQPCNRIYYSTVHWRFNMFRAAYRSSSGALTVFAASGLHTHVESGRSQVWVGTQDLTTAGHHMRM